MDSYNLLYSKRVPRQRERGFGALARTVARNTLPLLKKYVLPAAKKIGRDVIESAIPEIGGVLSGQTSIKKAPKNGNQKYENQVGYGIKKRKNTRQSITRQKIRKDFLKNLDNYFPKQMSPRTVKHHQFVLSGVGIQHFLSSLFSKYYGFVQ